MIEDISGKQLKAMTVCSLALQHLFQDLKKDCETRCVGLYTDDIKWVVTVPAIWTEAAKQFMSEAAQKAGIPLKMLTIALEPEAAAVFYRFLPMDASYCGSKITQFKPGEKYMVLDAGGGTVDIAVHKINEHGGIEEIAAVSGGGWGGILVDKEFETFMAELFGRSVLDDWKHRNLDEWMDLCRDFEVKKRSIKQMESVDTTIKLPYSLMKTTFSDTDAAKKVTKKKDKLMIEKSVIINCFKAAIDRVIKHVKDMLQRPALEGLSSILMVGGFSNSPLLQAAMKEAFPHLTVLHPPDANTCILKGAVIFGHNPKVITHRVVRYTYGVDVLEKFQEGKHPESRKTTRDKGIYCKDVFSKHVEIGKTVEVGKPQVEQTYYPVNNNQTSMAFTIYASHEKEPLYTDEGCVYLGKFNVDMSDLSGDLDREVKACFTFSDTIIKVHATFMNTGRVTSIELDFS